VLNFDRATRRVHRARELDQHAVTGGLDDATSMLSYFGIDKFFSAGL
jgi:hypothetical protein